MTETAAWDTYSKQKPKRRPVNAAGETTWFNWTQYPDHGPGTAILNITPGANVLDLGCGKGGNLAHLADRPRPWVGVSARASHGFCPRERWKAA